MSEENETKHTAGSRALTTEEIERAMREIPPHRPELHRELKMILSLVKRGIPVKTNAPAWIQATNAAVAWAIDSSPEAEA